ncbi:MAG: amidohydrolase [Actinomycetota bacterium]|nr:amidohydrolase [Actinomycetota bacterium]
MPDLTERVAAQARAIAPDAVRMRRDLHRHPELAWTERRTTYRIAEALTKLGLDPKVRPDGIGLLVEVGSGAPIVGFRADIDALPIQEETGAPYRSQVDGLMHACGHDAHAAIAVGIARTLTTLGDVPGTARFLFQPAEEDIPSGAAQLIEEGAHHDLDAIFAYHVDPAIRAGFVGLRVGPITSAADKVHIRLTGPGGHTSRPDRTVDLISVAARVVIDLPTLISQALGPDRHLTFVFGRIAGGGAANAIPSAVEISGTARVREVDVWRELPSLIERYVGEIAGAYGAGVELDYRQGSPPVDNDGHVIDVIRHAVIEILGPGGVRPTPQSMGSEDFSWFLEDVPGALVRLGVGMSDHPVDVHSPTFDLDETAIEHGIAVGALSLLRLMERPR